MSEEGRWRKRRRVDPGREGPDPVEGGATGGGGGFNSGVASLLPERAKSELRDMEREHGREGEWKREAGRGWFSGGTGSVHGRGAPAGDAKIQGGTRVRGCGSMQRWRCSCNFEEGAETSSTSAGLGPSITCLTGRSRGRRALLSTGHKLLPTKGVEKYRSERRYSGRCHLRECQRYARSALLKMVADESGRGRFYGLDIQDSAIDSTSSFLKMAVDSHERELVKLFCICHSRMEDIIPKDSPVRLVAFNLGYLPGGDKQIITVPETTELALQAASRIVGSGGLISVLVYIGHLGGRDELDIVESFASSLPADTWVSCKFEMINRPIAPVLVLLHKR
ncbi:hypothetical protein CFC21_109504 [Triticum aestivum]|uniref:rRNA methylase YtqB n=4 Tax=Triticinae TaxID=1648030 RepID=A0A453RZD4_AEGTS|nr:uncharacterized protein LOC123168338 [Triticum aestivum]KAF7109203.1 hypothetical protein CFC21_109504 [Triticum aestivum]